MELDGGETDSVRFFVFASRVPQERILPLGSPACGERRSLAPECIEASVLWVGRLSSLPSLTMTWHTHRPLAER